MIEVIGYERALHLYNLGWLAVGGNLDAVKMYSFHLRFRLRFDAIFMCGLLRDDDGDDEAAGRSSAEKRTVHANRDFPFPVCLPKLNPVEKQSLVVS